VRKNNEFKASIVTMEKGGFVYGAYKGKVAWDEWLCVLGERYLDYSIIDKKSQEHSNIKKIREKLNEEVEFKGPLLPLVA
jgi:hypothetical protein